MKIRLGVNIDHVATLRQVRGGTTSYPDLQENALEAIRGGADQITIHVREDRRHVQVSDLELLCRHCPVPINLEMASTPAMLKLALKYRPDFCCFVPEKRQELTTEGGLDVLKSLKTISSQVRRLGGRGIKSSMFIEPALEQVEASKLVGAFAIELHTGKWVLSKGKAAIKEWSRLVAAAQFAHRLGLKVHVGHGLDWDSARRIRQLPFVEEANIGHSIICRALTLGMRDSVQRMKKALRGQR